MKKRSKFDLPVDGLTEQYWTMEKLMWAFHECKRSDPETAEKIVKYACDCHHIPAKLAYGQFLHSAVKLKMSPAERYQKAEKILLDLINQPGIPESIVTSAAMELGKLYEVELRRPVGALAMYLYTQRLGITKDQERLARLKKQVENTCITQLCSNEMDLFRLGQELIYINASTEMTIWFLQEAIEKFRQRDAIGDAEGKLLHAQACLMLADYYDKHQHKSETYPIEREKMYVAAKQGGYPEYLGHSLASKRIKRKSSNRNH